MPPDPAAPPQLPLGGQGQEDSRVEERGEGGVQVLFQVLLQQALVRKMFLKNPKTKQMLR